MAENEIAAAGQRSDVLQSVDLAKITEYLDSTGLTKSLMPDEKAMFVNMAQLYGLNPFKREIYCTVFGQGQNRQCSIVTGYEVYLKRAERIGKLDGWGCEMSGKFSDGSLAATVTIHRKDWSHPFSHTVYYREVCQTRRDGSANRFWQKQPIFMTKKVAIAQAFRLCFPDEFGGMPYTSDEMGVDEREERDAPPVSCGDQPMKEESPADAAAALERVLSENKGIFRPGDYDNAMTCLRNGTPQQMREMYDWAAGFVQWARQNEGR